MIVVFAFFAFLLCAPTAEAQTCSGSIVTCAAAMSPHTWVEVIQNSTIEDILGCETGGVPTFNSVTNENECLEALNIFAFTQTMAWDSNTNKLYFIGKDHGPSSFHYVTMDGTTNNWSNICTATGCPENGDNTINDGGSPNPPDAYPCVQDWGLPNAPGTFAVSSIVGGSGYSNATGVAVTGGTGSTMLVDITTSGGAVTGVSIEDYPNIGHHYADGQVLTITGGGGNATFTLAPGTIGPFGCARGHGYAHIAVSPFTDITYFKMYGSLGSFPPDITKNFTRTVLQWAPGDTHFSLTSLLSPIYEQISSALWIPRHRDMCTLSVVTNCSDTAGGSLFVFDNANGDATHVNFFNSAAGNAASYDPIANQWFNIQTGFGGWPGYSTEATYNDFTNQIVFGGGYGGVPGSPTCPNPGNGITNGNFFDNCFLWKMDARGNITRLNDSPIPIGTQQANMTSDPTSSKIYIYSGNPANTNGCDPHVCSVNSGYVLDLLGNGGLGSYTAITSGSGDLPPANMTVPDSCPSITPGFCASFMATPAQNLGVGIYVTADYGGARTFHVFLHKGDGLQDWTTRSTAAGVIRATSFDTTTDFNIGTGGTNGAVGQNFGIVPPFGTSDYTKAVRDTSVAAEGASSLHFPIPANCSVPDCNGSWFTNFSVSLATQFGDCSGCGSDFYVQWRQMIDTNMLANDLISTVGGQPLWTGGEGSKQSLTGSGDQAPQGTGFIGTSCSHPEIGLTNDFSRGIPQLYNGCESPIASTTNVGFRPFEQNLPSPSTDKWLQNDRGNPYCLYSDGPSVGGSGYKNCFGYYTNEWITYQMHVHVGTRGLMPYGDDFNGGTQYGYGAGTISGNSITAGSVTGFAHNLSCSAPFTSGCGYIYYPGTGSALLFTTSYTTASTGGATALIAFETDNTGALAAPPFFFPAYTPNDEYINSVVELWGTRDGGVSQLIYSFATSPYGGTLHLPAGKPSAPEYYGKIWFLPYDTDRTTNTAPAANTWYDSLIISTNRIADPTKSGTVGPPAITCVTQSAVSTDRTTATTPTLAASSANAIIVTSGWVDSGHGITITDSAGNTYVEVATPVLDGNHESNMFWYANASTGTFTPTNLTVTATFSGVFPALAAYACTGTAAGNPIDGFLSTNSNTVSVGSLQYSSALTPNFSNALIIAGLTADGTSALTGSTSIDSGMTVSGATPGGSNSVSIASAYSNQTSITPIRPTWTVSPNALLNASLIAIRASNGLPDPSKCSGGSPTWTATSWDNIYYCHLAAINGDTINVAAGSYTTTQNLVITKYVKIQAIGTVNVTDNTCPSLSACQAQVNAANSMLRIYESTAGTTRLNGFHFIMGTAVHQNPVGVIHEDYQPGGQPIVISNNTYCTTTSCGAAGDSGLGDFIIWTSNRGVLSGNAMTSTFSSAQCLNGTSFVRQYASAADNWQSPIAYGSLDTSGNQALYIETNTFNSVFQAVDLSDSARSVIRYNTFLNSGLINHGVETSGQGARYADVGPNNSFIDDTSGTYQGPGCGFAVPNINAFIQYRAGTSLIHESRIDSPNPSGSPWGTCPGSSCKFAISFLMENLRFTSGPYPCWSSNVPNNSIPPGFDNITDAGAGYPGPQQVGWGYITGAINPGGNTVHQDAEPIYLWSNKSTGNYSAANPPITGESDQNDPSRGCNASFPSDGPYGSVSTYIVNGRDFLPDVAKPGYTPFIYPHPLISGVLPGITSAGRSRRRPPLK